MVPECLEEARLDFGEECRDSVLMDWMEQMTRQQRREVRRLIQKYGPAQVYRQLAAEKAWRMQHGEMHQVSG